MVQGVTTTMAQKFWILGYRTVIEIEGEIKSSEEFREAYTNCTRYHSGRTKRAIQTTDGNWYTGQYYTDHSKAIQALLAQLNKESGKYLDEREQAQKKLDNVSQEVIYWEKELKAVQAAGSK